MLFVLPYVPYPPNRGVFRRCYALIQELSKSFDLDVFCFSLEKEDSDYLPVLKRYANRVHFEPFTHPSWGGFFSGRLLNMEPPTVSHWWSPKILEAMTSFTRGQDYGIVYFVDIVLWPYIKQLFGRSVVRAMDRSRVDWLFQKEGFKRKSFLKTPKGYLLAGESLYKMSKYERQVHNEIDLEVVCGVDEVTFLKQKFPGSEKFYVLPNGYNADFFNPDSFPLPQSKYPSAIYCGALDYEPNIDALQWYSRKIHPLVMKVLPDFVFEVVGRNPTPEVIEACKPEGIELIGEVKDVRPYYQRSWLQAVPLRIGGGTRLKIVECLGMERPVVSTKIGAEGLDLKDGSEILIADTPEEIAESMIAILQNEVFRKALGAQGRKKAFSKYSWKPLIEGLSKHFKGMTEKQVI